MQKPNNMIEEVSKYMLTLKNMSTIDILMNTEKPKKMIVAPKKNIINMTDIFFPHQKDQLFWCFYISINNLSEYEMISSYFVTEKEMKFKWIEEFRKKKELFKPIKVSRNAVEDELANAKTITMSSIKALCYLKNINIFYIDNKKYYDIILNEEYPIYVIEKIEGKYGVKQKVAMEKIEYYRNNFWKLENLDKPLKAISSYKSVDLKDICTRLNIESNNMTKPQMYEKILSKL